MLPRGFCTTGPRGMAKDRSVRSQKLRSFASPAYLNINLVSWHLSATPGLVLSKCPMYFIFMRYSRLRLLF